MTDQLGQSQVIPYLKELSKSGLFNFTLISCEKKKYYEQNKHIVEDLLKDFPILWEPQIYHKYPPVLSALFDIWNIYRKTKSIQNKSPLDLIHCRSYISSLIGLYFKKKYNIPFIFDMRGFWADERVDGNLWNIKNPLYKSIYNFFKKKEEEFLIHSNAVVSLTESGKKEILKWEQIKISPDKINVIPCCADLKHFSKDTIDKNFVAQFKNKNKIDQADFVLSYLGAIGTWYMLPEMLDFFHLLNIKKGNCKFLFITPEESHELIKKEAAIKGIDSDRLILFHAKRKEVPSLLSISNYSIYFIKPAYSKISSSPTKQAEIMAMGIPAITNKFIGDTENILKESKAGIIIEGFNEECYLEIIDSIIKNKNYFDAEEIRKGASKYYELSKGAEKYLSIYNSIL